MFLTLILHCSIQKYRFLHSYIPLIHQFTLRSTPGLVFSKWVVSRLAAENSHYKTSLVVKSVENKPFNSCISTVSGNLRGTSGHLNNRAVSPSFSRRLEPCLCPFFHSRLMIKLFQKCRDLVIQHVPLCDKAVDKDSQNIEVCDFELICFEGLDALKMYCMRKDPTKTSFNLKK